MNKEVFIVEKVYVDDIIGNHYQNEYYSTTFEKALDYVKFHEGVDEVKQVNDGYWRVNPDYDSYYGIMKVELDQDLDKLLKEFNVGDVVKIKENINHVWNAGEIGTIFIVCQPDLNPLQRTYKIKFKNNIDIFSSDEFDIIYPKWFLETELGKLLYKDDE